MEKEWRLIYQCSDPETGFSHEEGKWPSCLPSKWRILEDFPREKESVVLRKLPGYNGPFACNTFALCNSACQRYLYWCYSESICDELPLDYLIMVYERQTGKINEINEEVVKKYIMKYEKLGDIERIQQVKKNVFGE